VAALISANDAGALAGQDRNSTATRLNLGALVTDKLVLEAVASAHFNGAYALQRGRCKSSRQERKC
jgi:hypothetical protein